MKRLIRAFTALFALISLAWYCLPSVYRTLHAPDCTERSAVRSAPALRVAEPELQFVRSGSDERLSSVQQTETTVRLFGVLPVRTFHSPAKRRSVSLGGRTVGVILKTQGVQIVGLGDVDTEDGRRSPAADAGLHAGDMILAVNGSAVSDTASFMRLCEASGGSCTLSCLRQGEPFTVTLRPERDSDGALRIGAWVRDSTSGIGTLSFFDPDTGAYAALGHGVTDVDTGKLLSPATGYLTEATVTGIRRGDGTEAGELIGTFSAKESDAIATVVQNTEFGIAGSLRTQAGILGNRIEIAPSDAAHLGDAYICSTVEGTDVQTYRVRVIRVDVQSAPSVQGLMIEIVDEALLDRTGGIVQGMSGSPLVQDGRLIGVVTHVFVSHPTRGYCLYAAWMSEKLLPST